MHGIGFLETLSAHDNSPRWHELHAGLFAYRCAEAALSGVGATPQELATAREAASPLPSRPVAQQLLTIIALSGPAPIDRTGLGTALLVYGGQLRVDGHIAAALDVYQSLVDLLWDEPELRLTAALHRAWMLRIDKQLDAAELAYGFLHSLADLHKNAHLRLEARLGLVKIAIERGELDTAALMLDRVLVSARRRQTPTLIGKALLDRVAIRIVQGDPVGALVDANEALPYVTTKTDHQRLLNNMGTAFREVGDAISATRIATLLAEHAVDEDVKANALILRYHLAIDAGDDLAMARALRALSPLRMSPLPAAEFFEVVARDHAAHRRWHDAEQAAEAMRETCRQAGMGELEARAASALLDIQRQIVPTVYGYRPVPLTTAAKRRLTAVVRTVNQLSAA